MPQGWRATGSRPTSSDNRVADRPVASSLDGLHRRCDRSGRAADTCQCAWLWLCQSDDMDPRTDLLCRRIELCRRVLREGVDAASSIHYLYEIFAAEEELAELLRLDPQPTQHSTAQP